MHLVAHTEPNVFRFDDKIYHQTVLSGPESRECSLWYDTFLPGAETPLHYCTCEQIVTVLSGTGEAVVDGRTYDLGPETTILVEPHVVRSLRAITPMRLLTVFVDPEPRILDPDGHEIEIPWLAMVATR